MLLEICQLEDGSTSIINSLEPSNLSASSILSCQTVDVFDLAIVTRWSTCGDVAFDLAYPASLACLRRSCLFYFLVLDIG